MACYLKTGHLVTPEALTLYRQKLAPHGLIAFHISNLYLDLSQTLAALARDAHLVCLIERDTAASEAEINAGKFPSIWVIMARDESDLNSLISANTESRGWQPIVVQDTANVCTDDYSNMLSAIRWKF